MRKIRTTSYILLCFFILLCSWQNIFANEKITKNKIPAKLITLNFREINVRDLLQILAEFSEKNVIISDKITGHITLSLHNVSWEQALDTILNIQGLNKREDNAMLFIAPNNEINAFSQQQTLRSILINLHYASAEEIANLLTKQHGLFSPQGNVTFDSRTNSLAIAEIPEKINTIQSFINKMDIPAKQALIEARIITADDDCIKDLGLKFSAIDGSGSATNNSSSSTAGNITDPGHFGMEIAKLGNGVMLDMELSALENAGHAKIISRPKLMTTNHKAAFIESGQEIPYQESTLSGATNVAFKKAVLSLQVTPDILSIAKTILHLQLNQDKVSSMTVNGVPAIQTQQIQSEVIVNNGETIVLGGIYEESNLENKIRTPFLSSIPLLGFLFNNKHSEIDHKELLIFITTKIIT